jgi:hypothetical protein
MTVDVCYDEFCELVARFVDQLAVPHTGGAFSAGGDSGSLVVSDDAFRHPVALLFAGSETQSIVSRIDRVLLRFGVAVDDGGTSAPITDAALTGLATPSFALVNQITTVGVDVRNAGTEPLPAFDVLFRDTTEAPARCWRRRRSRPARRRGSTSSGRRPSSARTRSKPSNSSRTTTRTTIAPAPASTCCSSRRDLAAALARRRPHRRLDSRPARRRLRRRIGGGVRAALRHRRARTDAGAGAQRRGQPLSRPQAAVVRAFPGGGAPGALPGVRAGIYDPEHFGVRMEAVRIGLRREGRRLRLVWPAARAAQAYAQPVVLGRVISQASCGSGRDRVWSSFWARGASAMDPPSAGQLFVGRHTGGIRRARAETARLPGAGGGSGPDRKASRAAPVSAPTASAAWATSYLYPLSLFTSVSHAVVSSAGMDGVEQPAGPSSTAPAPSRDALKLAIGEDWWFDPERGHVSEQVATWCSAAAGELRSSASSWSCCCRSWSGCAEPTALRRPGAEPGPSSPGRRLRLPD